VLGVFGCVFDFRKFFEEPANQSKFKFA